MNRCRVCGKGSLRVIQTESDNKIYYQCLNCRYTALDEAFYLNAAEEKERYLRHNNSLENAGYVAWLKRFLSFALTFTPRENARVLDFGSGPEPVLTRILRAQGYEAVCEDVYFAPGKPEGFFRLICAVEVLEHLSKPVDVLQGLAARLEAEGALCVSTEFLPRHPDDFEGWHYRSDATHIGFFTPEALDICAVSCGLVLSRCDAVRYAELSRSG
ncbi:MAG: hypothetical protein CSA76_01420 [Spirochaetales bacterium]|nr:MAG: hypothetical protein CSA76_01420 [Spirochaetales bacterium]